MSNPLAKAKVIAERFSAGAPKRPLARLVGIPEGVAWPANKADMVGELFVYEQIGVDWWTGEGITGKSVAAALESMKGVKTLNIFINSPGGEVFEAAAIYSLLTRFEAKKVVHIDGIAASAATFIAMAGDRIVCSPVATWMVHEAWTMAAGPAGDLRAIADRLEMLNGTIAETYAKVTGGTVAEMLKLMADETWMNAQESVDKGFAHEIAADPDEEGEPAAAAKKSPAVALVATTQARIKSVSAGQLLAARADMHRRDHPVGQPTEKQHPASR